MLRIGIAVIVSACMTFLVMFWLDRQLRSAGRLHKPKDKWCIMLLCLQLSWTMMWALMIWVGFLEPVRDLTAYPFKRLFVSMLVGLGMVAGGLLIGRLWTVVHGPEDAAKLPVWRRANPMGCQLIFILFSGLAFVHRWWGGPP